MLIEAIKEESMVIQWIGITTALFAGIALILNFLAFRKQQKNTQVNLLAEFVSRFFDLIDKQKEYYKEKKIGEFCVLFLNLLEWFAYLVNHKYLPLEMAEIYQGVIINWYEKVRIGQKEVLADYLEDQPQKFSELDEFYKKLKRLND